MNTIRTTPRRRQRGVSTLLIAMLLLVILTIVTVFSVRIGLSEQRVSSNEYRQKMVFQIAESGLSLGVEYLKQNTDKLVSSTTGGWLFEGYWQPCTAPFEGGAANLDPCNELPDGGSAGSVDVRSGSYRYVGPASSGKSGRLPLDAAAVPSEVGGFDAAVRTYATLCRLDMSLVVDDKIEPRCSLSPAKEGTFYVTVVSTGALANENSAATVKQSFGTFRLVGRGPDVPLVAAGIVNTAGSAELVPNPDAAGFGVPLSIWSQGDAQIDKSNINTCQLGEWLVNYGNSTGPTEEELANGICANCVCKGLCPGSGLLSGDAAACPTGKDKMEGEDILDVDSHFSDASPKVRDSKYFPDDLFAYVFGVPSGVEEDAFLKKNAKTILSCDSELASLGANAKGFYWYRGTQECGLSADAIGTPQRPVVLVSDKPVHLKSGVQFFGIIFVRSEAGGGTLLHATGGGQVYGSAILEGNASLAGNLSIIFNKAVLRNLANSPDFVRYGPIPGSWSDSLREVP